MFQPSTPHDTNPADTASLETLRSQALDRRLGDARILVLDAENGRRLIERSADVPTQTASVMKTITSAAALSVLGPNHRIETRVLRGETEGEIILQGGGDVTLTRVVGNETSFYGAHATPGSEPARLEVLATLTLQALGGTPPRRIVLDASLFAQSEWRDDQWHAEDRDPGGYMPFITALQCDGDREDPLVDETPRSDDPVGRVGDAFAALIGGSPEIVRGSAPSNRVALASVWSAPVSVLVTETLRSSDNALAEALARLIALASGEEATFDGIERALIAFLNSQGVPTNEVRLLDGSGLSAGTRVSASTIADLLHRAWKREGSLGQLLDSLTQSGSTMSQTRFTGDNAVVGDSVRAKSGYIGSVHSLAGIVRTVQGHDLVFTIYAMGENMLYDDPARLAVDDLVTQLHLHGDALVTLDAPLELGL